MSKEKNGRSAGMHVGSASIVMIFAILCLTVFSTLSFVTANHERSLAEKSALTVQQYYDADWQCEEIYEQIYQCLQENDNIERLQTLGVEMVQQNETRYLSYAVDIDDQQALAVRLAVLPDGTIHTEQWKVIATTQWEYSDEIAVWNGD